MKVIIAPTDFSDFSVNAVNYAADMATSIHASLALFHVCQMPINISEVPVPADTLTILIKDAEKGIEKLKKDIVKRTAGKIRVYTEVKTGFVIQELEEYCKALKPYAVVMSTQGAGAVERFLFGSNIVSAMKHLAWPLIIVPPQAEFTSIKKIGLACDMKNVMDTAPVEEIKTLVKEFNASLQVIHINTGEDFRYGPEIVEQTGLLQEMLDELHPSYHFLDEIDIEEGLSAFAEINKLDLLIVVPKKHNVISKLFNKRHSKQLLMHTNIPVMAVHE
jgi:nucleotide-binding universal stress UspA family protein